MYFTQKGFCIMKNNILRVPDKMEAWVDVLCLFVQPKEGKTNLKTNKQKKQSELPENCTVWKSNNRGLKEETFIQTGRRNRDRQPW